MFGIEHPGSEWVARLVEKELLALPGVTEVAANQATGRVVVAVDDAVVDLDAVIAAVQAVETIHDLGPDADTTRTLPGDEGPVRLQRSLLVLDSIGLAVSGLAPRILPVRPFSAEVAALIGMVQASPAARRWLEERSGAAAGLGLAAVHALAQGFAGSPLGPVVDGVYRALLLAELQAQARAWDRLQPRLDVLPVGPVPQADRPAPVPPGHLDRFRSRSMAAAFAAAAAVLAATRDPRLAVAGGAAATPKAAQLGPDSFAAVLGRLLADRGVVSLDSGALRRLGRIDTVVLDAEVLLTGESELGSLWVAPEAQTPEDEVWLRCHGLFDPSRPRSAQQDGPWRLAPSRHSDLRGAARVASRHLSGRPGSSVLALRRGELLVGLVEVRSRLDPLARVLAEAAKETGELVVAGTRGRLGERLGAARSVRGGPAITTEVRGLQSEGRVVAVVTTRWASALAAADVGIGVLHPGREVPWAADLVASRGLLDAWLVLQAVPVARQVERHSVSASRYGAAAAGLLTFAGGPAKATARASLAVNSAAAAAVGIASWAASTLGRRPEPVGDDDSDWHAVAAAEVLDRTGSRLTGLTASEVEHRIAHRPADITERRAVGILQATLEELGNPLTPTLAVGAGLSAAMGSVVDAGLIGSVMLLNAALGGAQKVGTDRALAKLLDTTRPKVHVRRDGVEVAVHGDGLVVGDVVVLTAGDAVPADCRVIGTTGVEVDESSLTGESQTVEKTADPVPARAVADRRSMLYAGTVVAAGEVVAVVVAVGDATQAGRSRRGGLGAPRTGGVERRLRELTAQTVPLALGASAAVVGAGVLHRRPLARSLSSGVGLAVAAVPEGLPLVATVAQLASARRLSRRRVLVRHPTTIEALGRVDVLCADKTGTLTTGRIQLKAVYDGVEERPVEALDDRGRQVLAAALRATSPASVTGQIPHPTDRAVIEGAATAGVTLETEAVGWVMDSELVFEPSRGYHAVLGRVGRRLGVSVKGSPEVVVPRCTTARMPEGPVVVGPDESAAIAAEVDRLARHGYRVLAVAERPARTARDLEDERVADLELIGLLAMADPIRPSAAEAVDGLRAAGVDVVMVTGDHPSTAEAIASELGVLDDGGVLTGPELDALTDEELAEQIRDTTVFARVSPLQKVRIVAAFQARGRTVAMTGDGANDAPAIRLADVGVALGPRATNAAKEAADVVVTDERIETIIDAILEGRGMWASVRDAVAVLVGGNLGEIAFELGTDLFTRRGSPLNARQLLLVNLLTDLVPAMALAIRPPSGTDPATLAREGPETSLGGALTRDIWVRGSLTAGAGICGLQAARLTGVTQRRAGTVALVSLVGSQLGQTLVAGRRDPLVVGSTVVSAAALLGVIQTPGVSQFFGCRPLGPIGWGIGTTAAVASALAVPLVSRAAHRVAPDSDRG